VFEEVAFVGLIPIHLTGGNRTNVQSIDIWGVDQLANQLGIGSDCRHHQTWAQRFGELVSGCFHHTGKGKQKLFVSERMRGIFAKDDRALEVYESLLSN
jgi:hypothetical protein